jgi:hypothetical protein
MKKKTFLSLSILIIILIFFFKFNGLEDLIDSFKHLKVEHYIFLTLLQLLTISLTTYQWVFLVNKTGKISFFKMLQINLAGTFVESVTPSSRFGGEGAKVFLLKKSTELNYTQIASKMILLKFVMLFPFMCMTLLFFLISLFNYKLPNFIYLSFLGIFIFFSVLFFLAKKSKLKESNSEKAHANFIVKFIDKTFTFFSESCEKAKKILTKKEIIYLMLISSFVWFLYPVKFFLVSNILGFEIPFGLVVLATFSAYTVSIMPVTPGGVGTFEASMALIFSINGLIFSSGVSISILARTFTFWLPLFLSILASFTLLFPNIKNNKKLKKEFKNAN